MPYKELSRQAKYQLIRYHQKRGEFFNGKSCVECGRSEKLQLDHIEPKDKISHRIWSWSKDRILKELEKCQILCSKCHNKKTKVQNGMVLRHSTNSMYNKGCRCGDCTKAHAQYKKGKYIPVSKKPTVIHTILKV